MQHKTVSTSLFKRALHFIGIKINQPQKREEIIKRIKNLFDLDEIMGYRTGRYQKYLKKQPIEIKMEFAEYLSFLRSQSECVTYQ